jgi:spore coat polysaccharide biosynthesis protein SpsF
MGIIVQARTGSTRLPNKILKPFYNDFNIIDLILERLKNNKLQVPVILATSTNVADSKLKDIALRHNVHFYQGDEQNVLSRFIGAAQEHELRAVMRVCSDNPFLHLESIDFLIEDFIDSPVDYSSFRNKAGTPVIKTHYGLFTEIISLKALEKVQALTQDSFYCEHVTNFIYGNPDKFSLKLQELPAYLAERDDIRLTIDTVEDFENLKKLYLSFIGNSCNFDLQNLVEFIDQDPILLSAMKASIIKNSK